MWPSRRGVRVWPLLSSYGFVILSVAKDLYDADERGIPNECVILSRAFAAKNLRLPLFSVLIFT
jgi:hypothetical protein